LPVKLPAVHTYECFAKLLPVFLCAFGFSSLRLGVKSSSRKGAKLKLKAQRVEWLIVVLR
jgi:hypothetical protein